MADTPANPFPTSYNDPVYASADQAASASVGIPAGWLTNIRTKGEKSNADQVSSAGARTPYQITPDTRKAIIDQTGVDPYLNPNNAAYGAAYLLKQSLDRNGGNPILATAEYHGGTDQANWGPKTMAYVKRVTGASPNNPNATPSFGQGASNGYQLQAAPQISNDQDGPSPLQQIYTAYKSGKMSPEDARAFESDVQGGHIVLPAGSQLNPQDTGNQPFGTIIQYGPNGQDVGETNAAGQAVKPGQPQAQAVPQQVVDAFNSGKMSQQDAQQFAADVKAGAITLPQGASLSPPNPSAGHTAGVAARGYLQGLSDTVGSVVDKAKNVIDMPVNALNAVMQGGGALNAVDQAFGTHLAPQPTQSLTSQITGQPQTPLAGAPQAAPNIPSLGESATAVMDKAGVPQAQTPTERTVQAAAQGAGAMTVPMPGMGLKAIPGMIAAGAAGGAVGDAVHQATGSPMLGMAANILTTVLSPAAAARVMKTIATELPSEAAAAARVEPTMQASAPETPAAQGAAPTAGAESAPAPAAAAPASSVSPSPAASAAPDSAAVAAAVTPAQTASAIQPGSAAIWRNADTDIPVTVKNIETQPGSDGRMYARVEHNGRDTFEPADQLQPQPVASNATQGVAAPVDATAATTAAAPDLMSSQELAEQARKAVGSGPLGMGKSAAQDALASQVAPDQTALKYARDLGVEDYVDADHVTTNQAYRELAAAAKSIPGSDARAAEIGKLEQIGARAQQIVTDAGGTSDLSQLSSTVKGELMNAQNSLDSKAEGLYKQVMSDVGPTMPITAPKTGAFLEQRAEQFNGVDGMPSLEKKAYQMLTPKQVSVDGEITVQRPTYTMLDYLRKQVGNAIDNPQFFKDSDQGTLKNLYGLLLEDQRMNLENVPGALEKYDLASATTQMRKSVEGDMISLFGRKISQELYGAEDSQVGGALATPLRTAMMALPKGNESNFVNLINAVPKSLRQDVTVSGLRYAFNRSLQDGTLNFHNFANWWDGLKQNSQAFNAVMANLPEETRAELGKMAYLSRGISDSLKNRIMTGRLGVVAKDLQSSDGVVSKVMATAKKGSTGALIAGAAHAAGPVGAGAAELLLNMLDRGKPQVAKAVGDFITSPEFSAVVKSPATASDAAIKTAANSPSMKRFFGLAKAGSAPNDPASRERWLRGILASAQSGQAANTKR